MWNWKNFNFLFNFKEIQTNYYYFTFKTICNTKLIEYGFKKEILLINSDGERDIEKIIQFIQKNHSFLLSCTFKSIDVIWKIIKYLNKKEVIFIIDEFHNLSSNNIVDEENDFYQLLHSDQRI